MNGYPESRATSTHIKMGVAVALSVLACGSATANAAQKYNAAPTPTAESPAGPMPSGVVEMGIFATAHANDVYATRNLPRILKRIGGCETKNSPVARINYTAQNPTTSASGGFQFMYETWDHFMGYDEAWKAPHRVQNKKAIITLRKYGTAPWAASHWCWD